jgi:hypothetical protein
MAKLKKRNGRPTLKDGKRTKKLDVRFTEEEYGKLIAMENEFGISKSELVRKRVLNGADKAVLNARELIRLLDGFGAEMGRAGNNINQLAKHANTMKLMGAVPPSVAGKFNVLLEDYVRIQQDLQTALRKILQVMGK